MPQEVIFQLVVYFCVAGLIFSLIIAALIKFFERALTFTQAFMISAETNFVTLVLLFAYQVAKPQLGIPNDADILAILGAMMLTGIMITQLSANYGMKKVGWFGLGAKVVFGLFVLNWVFAAAVFLLIYLFGH